ncbi:ubx domain-containing protein 1 [Holotrichia oblita]|uniref:Ubx domain-containing protein 1 n=1 Tax=Holotrichia oblita TaxID=644536 RepID=A0ACB9T185_HOLOL|nr:ubx domain-containing protein 1 [Holotrichia oblita]
MSDVISILIEMGFSKTRAEQAVATTRTDDVQVAMDWILSNEDDPVIEPVAETSDSNILEPPEKDTTTDDKVTADETDASSTSQQVAKSIRCDDCLKLFANQTDVEVHASKTGHENFSESSEEKKPLTEEEKKEQLARIEAKLKQRRLEREAKEKVEEKERELHRIKSGKEILEAKKRHEELETKKLLELRRKEKEETRLAKERVKAQIEQDKIARRLKFGGAPPIEKVDSTPDTTVVTQKLSQPQNYSEVKLQIRLTNGSTLVHTFGAKEPLPPYDCMYK